MKKIKKILFGLLTYVLVLFSAIPQIYAEDMVISANGWREIGENEVFLKTNIINLHTLRNQNAGTMELPEGFSFNESKQYTSEQYTNGTYDSERNTALTYDVISGYAITYNNSLDPGTHQIPGTIKLKWNNGAFLADGTLCDVTMTIDNITIKNVRKNNRPVSILLSGEDKKLEASIYFARQETAGNESQVYDIGAKYDITFSITKAGTDEKVHKNMIFSLQDMDQPDSTAGTIGNLKTIYTNTDGTIADYVEGVTLISGVTDKIYLMPGYLLNIGDTSYGRNTRFAGNQGVNNTINGVENTEGMRKAGLMTRVNSDEFKFEWSGSYCRTAIIGSALSKVVTSTSGAHKNHVQITETDNEVLWKEDKKIEMVPDSGYHVSKVTVNGKTISFTPDSTGKVTYIFEDVIEDQRIDVQVEPNNYIIHYDAGGGKGTMDDTIAEYDVKDNLSKNEFTNEGYTFIGWKAYYKDDTGKLVELKDENGKVITFKDKDEFINLIGKNNGEVTLVAQWKKPLLVNVPKTSMQTPLIILGVGLIAVATAVGVYVYKGKQK